MRSWRVGDAEDAGGEDGESGQRHGQQGGLIGQILEVHCRACGADEHQLDGALFAGYQPRCDRCGERRLIPRDGSGGAALPVGRSPEAIEAWVSERAGTCSCGGQFSDAAPIRCLQCRSTDVSGTTVGTAD